MDVDPERCTFQDQHITDFDKCNQISLREAIRTKNTNLVKDLIANGIEVNGYHMNIPYQRPLHLAVISRSLEIVDVLMSGGANVNLKSLDDETPLTLAAKIGDVPIMDLLLSHNVKNYEIPHNKFSHLHVSCMRNKVEVVKKLISLSQGEFVNEAVTLDSLCWAGFTPLHFAVQYGCIEVVKLLLECGASITAQDKQKMTPLHLADFHRNNEIIDLILSAHKNEFRNPSNDHGLSHFHIACTRDDVSVVGHFLKLGAKKNLEVKSFPWNGFKPVDFAMYYECQNVVELLVRGNKVQWSDHSDGLLKLLFRMKNRAIYDLILLERISPPYYVEEESSYTKFHQGCVQNDRKKLENLLSSLQICAPSDFDTPNWSGRTPIHLAIQCQSFDAVKFLLEHGANFMVQDPEGKTPLHIAFESRQTKMVDKIIETLGNRIQNLTDGVGLSIFHILCSTNRVASIKSMIAKGVNINAQVGDTLVHWARFTPLHFAAKFQQDKVVILLLKQNPDISLKNAMNMNPLDLLIHELDINYDYAEIESIISEILMTIFSSQSKNMGKSCMEMNPLHVLCFNSETDLELMSEYLISHHGEVNSMTNLPNSFKSNQCTALHLAMQRHHFNQAKLLIEKGANPLLMNGNSETPFECAASELGLNWETPDAESFFFTQTSIGNLKPSHFHLACALGLTNFVKYILQKTTDDELRMGFVNCSNDAGQTPLQSLLIECNDTTSRKQLTHLLLEYGADVNSRDFKFATPLHRMIRPGDLDVVRTLVSYGADVNARDVRGLTPVNVMLMEGSMYNKVEILSFLLENGVDINIANDLAGICLIYKDRFQDEVSTWNDDIKDCAVKLFKHVKKLQTIELRINNLNLLTYAYLSTELTESFDEAAFVNECRKELESMMKIDIDSRTTLHDVLFKNLNRMAILCNNLVLRTIVASEFFNRFPIYGFLIRLKVKNGEVRGPLLMESEKSLTDLSRGSLPVNCLEMILQYLSNVDLKNIILSTTKTQQKVGNIA